MKLVCIVVPCLMIHWNNTVQMIPVQLAFRLAYMHKNIIQHVEYNIYSTIEDFISIDAKHEFQIDGLM